MCKFHRFIIRLLMIIMFCTGLPLPLAHAGMVSTPNAQSAASEAAQSSRARMAALLARSDVRESLQRHGISADEAHARVAALSDEEVDQLAGRMDALPAGADGILGLLFVTFIVLLITDIFGFTKVFPFTRSVR